MRSFLKLTVPHSRKLMNAILLSSASMGAAMGLLATSAWLISEASTRPPVLALEVAIVAVRTFGLSRGVIKYVSRIIEHDVALQMQTEARVKFYQNLIELPTLVVGRYHRGQVMQQLVSDVDTSQDLWLRLWNPWASALITGVAGIGIIYAFIPTYAYCLAILFLIAMGVPPLVAYASNSSSRIREQESELLDNVVQSFESVDESILFNYQTEIIREVDSQQEEIAKLERRAAMWSGVATAGYAKTLGISLILGVLFSSDAFAKGEIAGIDVAVVLLLPLAIFDGVGSLALAFSRAISIRDAIKAIEPLIASTGKTEAINQTLTPARIDSLEVINLAPKIPSLELPSFNGKAEVGKPWIIAGKSGLGKSSLLNALAGLIDYEGDIIINGRKISNLDPSFTTTLLQDDHLFSTSIRENLKVANPVASDDELYEVLQDVELGDLISSLPEGLNTFIGDFGYNFSGGERQRMKLARVLLRDSGIYLLDEPFEYLSNSQAMRLQNKIFEKLTEKIVIIVSHLPIFLTMSTDKPLAAKD